jgi:hypothetical protein
MSERERRIGLNEAFFREVNERLEDIVESVSTPSALNDFICECAAADCTERIALTLEEYRQVRAKPTTFAVKPGHEVADAERVVLQNDRYALVEKEGEAGQVAVETDSS